MSDTYVFLIIEPDWNSDAYLPGAETAPEDLGASFAEHGVFAEAVAALGARIAESHALQQSRHGGTVTPGAGERKVEDAVYTDGPFTDTTEVVTGFYTVEVADEAMARHVAALVPTGGHIEWRKVFPMGGDA